MSSRRHDPEAIIRLRARSTLWRAVDHGPLPSALVGMTTAVAAFALQVVAEGRLDLVDGPALATQAGVAIAAVVALGVLGAAEAGAWLLSRSVGRDLARVVVRLEGARRRVSRISVTERDDAALDAAGMRIEHARNDLLARLAQLDGALDVIARLPDLRMRALQLERIRAESVACDRAAGAYDAAARLLRSSATSPWELSRDEAVVELTMDLERAQRLLRGG